MYERAAFHENGILLYSYYRSRVDYLSLENGKRETVFEFEGDKDNALTPTDNIFVRENDCLYFHTVEVDKLYRIDKRAFTAIATIDYDMKRKAKKMHKTVGSANMSMDDNFKYSRPRIMGVVDHDGKTSLIFNKLVSCINIDRGDDYYENRQISSLMGSINFRRIGNDLVGWEHALNYDKEKFDRYHRYDGIQVNHIDASIDEIDKNGNPILVVYKLK
jgi:hypothetical protein